MWKFLGGGATVIPAGTFIPESRVGTFKVQIWPKLEEEIASEHTHGQRLTNYYIDQSHIQKFFLDFVLNVQVSM